MKKLLFFISAAMSASVSPLKAQNASVQVIHNAADLAADTVDVWISSAPTGKVKLLNKFAFRTASPFVSAPAGTPLRVVVTPKNSTDTLVKVKGFTFNLKADEKYILIANGIVSASGYTPSSAVAPFNLHVFAPAQQTASVSTNTDVLVYHGATDAPTVAIKSGTSTLIPAISYSQYNSAGYLKLPTADYPISVVAGNTTVATYSAPLQTLGLANSALTVLASGFLNPAVNSNGKSFGLWAALPAGGKLVELPLISNTSASVQVIHNAADLAADTVDVWISSAPTGKVKLLNKFAFRTASPFVSAPAGTPLRVVVTPKNSTDTLVKVKGFTFNLKADEKYILIANGIVSASGYTPSSAVAPFNLHVFAPAQQTASVSTNTDVLVYHGATDAPTVAIKSGTSTLIPDISYSQYNSAGYLKLPTADYPISVVAGSTTVATYSAPLQTLGLGNSAITVLASGFLNPAVNSNGKSFGLWAALPSGGKLVELPIVTGIKDINFKKDNLRLYPNPASNNVSIELNSAVNETISLKMYDAKGAIVKESLEALVFGKNTIELNLTGLEKGIYFIQLFNSNTGSSGRIIIE